MPHAIVSLCIKQKNIEMIPLKDLEMPVNELPNVSKDFGVLDLCLDMITNGCNLSKVEWKMKIWEIA